MKVVKTSPGCNLFLGHQGEKLALQIVFDIAPWLETYGFGTAHLLHQRKGDAEPYPVATTQEGNEVWWDVSNSDTAVEGAGRYELHFYTGETLVKSVTGDTLTAGALQYGVAPPEPVQLWLDHVAEKEHELFQAVDQSTAAAQEAKGSATAAAQSEAEAKKAAEEAKNAGGSGSGVEVTAKPGQLIRVKETDENGKPTAWEAVPWGYTEGGMVEILPETELTLNVDTYFIATKPPKDTAIGERFTVNWNGVEYKATALDGAIIGMPFPVIFNDGINFETSENAIFAIMVTTEEKDGAYGFAMLFSGDSPEKLTLAITQDTETIHPIPGELLPEGVPYVEKGGMVEILPECQPAYDADEGLFQLTENAPPFAVGETYIVNWNGTEYTCIGQDMSAMSPGAVFLGDGSTMGMPSNGEPFAIVSALESDTQVLSIIPFDGTTELTISIKVESVKVNKIDPRCLPDGVGGGVVMVNGDLATMTADTGSEQIRAAMMQGKTVFLNLGNGFFTLSCVGFDATDAFFVSLNTGSTGSEVVDAKYFAVKPDGSIIVG